MNTFFILLQSFNFIFQAGDILFQDCDCGSMCDAIEAVTKGVNNRNYSHIAMVVNQNDTLKVIEANIYGVKIVHMDSFIHRYHDKKGNPTISIGRLKDSFQYLIPKAVEYSMTKQGIGYDTVFLFNNGLYYCSELIYEAFRYANLETDFFKFYPMTYKPRKDKRKTHPAFQSYYKYMNCQIPEGKPGINPGSISRDKRLEIFHLY